MSLLKFNSLLELTRVLSSQNINYLSPKKFNNILLDSSTYLLKKNKIDNINTVNCYKSNNNIDNMICNLDYIINLEKKYIKIDSLSINNDYYDRLYNHKLDNYCKSKSNIFITEDDVKLLKLSLINHVSNVAINNDIKKIFIYVHSDLHRYNSELKEEGFVLTKNINENYSYMIEAEKNL